MTTSTSLSESASTLIYGQPETLTATVTNTLGTSATPKGLVPFFGNAVAPAKLLGQSARVGGVAKLPGSPLLAAGTYAITTTYVATANFATSTAATASGLQIAPASTSVSVGASITGNQVIFSGTVTNTSVYPSELTSPPLAGVVQIYDGTKHIASVTGAANGAWTTTALTLASGSHSITVMYLPTKNALGNLNHLSNSASETITV